ncbi:MAG: hypothetical protein EOM58_08060 [Clostridia bacterium]|nr:hypothetical protein [Clostridia bacterium]
MFKKWMKPNSVQLARPKPQTVHGIEIRKQPVGRYFEVLDQTGAIVSELLDAAFPGMTPGEILTMLTKVTNAELKGIFVRVMGELPRKLVAVLRSIVGADDNPAWDELTPAEMAQVCEAFWALNDMTDFFKIARSALQQLIRQQTKTDSIGSNA